MLRLPVVIGPTNAHVAQDTSRRDICECQAVSDKKFSSIALIDPGGQSLETAVDFPHLPR